VPVFEIFLQGEKEAKAGRSTQSRMQVTLGKDFRRVLKPYYFRKKVNGFKNKSLTSWGNRGTVIGCAVCTLYALWSYLAGAHLLTKEGPAQPQNSPS
jgi:hypothetical protein